MFVLCLHILLFSFSGLIVVFRTGWVKILFPFPVVNTYVAIEIAVLLICRLILFSNYIVTCQNERIYYILNELSLYVLLVRELRKVLIDEFFENKYSKLWGIISYGVHCKMKWLDVTLSLWTVQSNLNKQVRFKFFIVKKSQINIIY